MITQQSSTGAPLTEREREVAVLIAQGYSLKYVARELGIRPCTVDAHLKNIADKVPDEPHVARRHRIAFALAPHSTRS